ncbi:MAG: carboxypeptidase regulatory-like domain-containing protein [Acidobacteriota bacterium]|nr:carboxypeptidase regulatory-like domain-containing protein [Acidobacteriota bacterium]
MAAAIFLTIACACFAQVDLSGITGTIRDASGRVVPEAAVLVRNVNNGLERQTTSNRDGIYSVEDLPSGTYSAMFSKPGFKQIRFENIEQAIGQTHTIDPVFSLSVRNEFVTVAASAVQLDQTSAALGGRIEQPAIQELPLNGRNWANLTALVPGAIDSGGSTQRSIRFVGRGRDDMNITYDGVDATGVANQAQKAYVRLSIPTESIAEFRVVTAQYSAEYGDAAGAQIVVASPSGNNALHGSLFEYLRNSFFDARSPLDKTNSPLPFRLNQFGGSFSGPIRKSKTLFFFAYEGFRQVQDQTLIGFVPSASFRNTVLSTSPALSSILHAYPIGTATTNLPAVSQYAGVGGSVDNENSAMLRADHYFTDRTTGYLRFNYDHAISTVPLGSLLDRQKVDTVPTNGVAEILHVFSPSLLNEFKFGINQAISRTYNLTSIPYVVNVSGFSALNSNQSSDQDGATFSWLNNLSWARGRHLVKAGVAIRRIQMNEGSSAYGTLTYTSPKNFARNLLDQANEVGLLPLRRMRKTQEAGFLQDEFKIRSNFFLNAELRYEYFSVFHESVGRALPFDFETCGGFCPPGSAFYYPSKGALDPRIGLAWSPARSGGKTVVRAGYGMYHEDGQLDDQNFPIANDVLNYNLTRGTAFPNLSFPIAPFLAEATGVLAPKDLYRRRKDMYAQDWSFSVQQRLPQSLAATVSYLGSKGTNVMNRSYTNLVDPLTGTRSYAQFGRIESRGNNSNSTFEAAQASLRRTFRGGWLMGANYMWSHAINDASLGSGVEDDFPQNVACRACERASSDQDARHVFSAYTVYQLPFGAGQRLLSDRGWLRSVLGGWELNGVATARAGLPVNITVDRASSALPDGNSGNQRPNLIPGVSLAPAGGSTPSLWINPAAFAVPASGTWGNLGRNAFNGPPLRQIDTALSKSVSLRERATVQFRAECFNLLNRAQYRNPLTDISAGASFGKITSLANTSPTGSGTPRQFQFSVRVGF